MPGNSEKAAFIHGALSLDDRPMALRAALIVKGDAQWCPISALCGKNILEPWYLGGSLSFPHVTCPECVKVGSRYLAAEAIRGATRPRCTCGGGISGVAHSRWCPTAGKGP